MAQVLDVATNTEVVVAATENLLFAETINSQKGLVVYASTMLKDTSETYRPVVEWLREHDSRLVSEDKVRDPMMMRRSAWLRVYEAMGLAS